MGSFGDRLLLQPSACGAGTGGVGRMGLAIGATARANLPLLPSARGGCVEEGVPPILAVSEPAADLRMEPAV